MWSAVSDNVLGTLLHVRAGAPEAGAQRVYQVVCAEIARLDAVFSTYRADSELSRWARGEVPGPGAELTFVLARAQDWHERSGGAFHPATWPVTRWWLDARERGRIDGDPPAAGPLPFRVDDGRVTRTGDCTGVDLNALAKGYIVDRALEAGWATGLATALVVNLGGDLRHRGEGEQIAAIENPATPWDNAPPLCRLALADRALATSGSARRGFRIGARWYSHVLDPRTGTPQDSCASISVVAGDCMTADVIATVLGVGGPGMPVPPGVEWLSVGQDGSTRSSAGWGDLVR